MLARSELITAANLLLDRYPDMQFSEGFQPVERGLKMRSPESVRVRL
jgi:hypothetical protein